MVRSDRFPGAATVRTILSSAAAIAALGMDANAEAGFKSFNLGGGDLVCPYSINRRGDVVGYYLNRHIQFRGFIRAADGTIITFTAHGAGKGNSQGTYAFSINDEDAVTGSYTDENFYGHGYVCGVLTARLPNLTQATTIRMP
jgi:hypothetical protein